MDSKNTKIRVKLPCKCIKEININSLEVKTNKYFIRYIKCNEHNVSGKDVFLKKINEDLYKAILDQRKERRIFKEEDDFFVFTYNKVLSKCSECGHDIRGKNMISVNNYKRSYWEVNYKCPNCGFPEVARIDARDIESD